MPIRSTSARQSSPLDDRTGHYRRSHALYSAKSFSGGAAYFEAMILSTMNWKPGIGDPTFIGWFAVFGYFSTAALSAYVASRLDRRNRASQRKAWWILSLVLVALGINKQLDLQGLLMELGRSFAYEHGVYEKRRVFQVIFLFLLAVVSLTIMFLWFWINRQHWRDQRWMLVGSLFLGTFVLVRAASFHHFQDFFAFPLGGVKLHRIIELFAIAWLAASGIKRLREIR